jgi:hypothetical protein
MEAIFGALIDQAKPRETQDLSSEQNEKSFENNPSRFLEMNFFNKEKSSRMMPKNRVSKMSSVLIRGQLMASLIIDGKERVCLAQISNTLLKKYSYNEIHNRRVALGINCIQCTPGQLEMLREAGAMPVSSRRCGMITKKEAERLVKSFLDENKPPSLPDSFTFKVQHKCAFGCKGTFSPARYNSSRAKCIRCSNCNLFFSPNKFIFHSHETPDSKYTQTGTVNFNSWRKHIFLINPNNDEDLNNAWEDVKSIFNSGKRRRSNNPHSNTNNINNQNMNISSDSGESESESNFSYSFDDYNNDSSDGKKLNSSQSEEEKFETKTSSEKNRHVSNMDVKPNESLINSKPQLEPGNFMGPPALPLFNFMNPFYQTAFGQLHLAKFLPALFELNNTVLANFQNQLADRNLQNEKVFQTSRPGMKQENERPNLALNNEHLMARFNLQQLDFNNQFIDPTVISSMAANLLANKFKIAQHQQLNLKLEESHEIINSNLSESPESVKPLEKSKGFVSIAEHLE